MVCFILQLVSWLFSLLSPSSLHRGLMALSPPSPSPQSSHAGPVLCLTRLAGRPFSPAASADMSVIVSMEMCFTLYFSFFLVSRRGRMHIPPEYLPALVHLKMRVSVQIVSESVMGREELTTLHITQVSVVQANMSRIACYGSHRQADLTDRKLT